MSGITKEERLEIKKKTHKQMMWVAISSIVMLFAGLSSAFIVARSGGTWIKITPPTPFITSTIVLLLSSVTFAIAVNKVKKEQYKVSTVLVGVTLILGVLFVKFQLDGWDYLKDRGQYFAGHSKIEYLLKNSHDEVDAVYGEDYVLMFQGNEMVYHEGQFYDKRDTEFSLPNKFVDVTKDNNAASYMYMLTGLHVVHLLGGLISLIVVFIKSLRGRYTKETVVGIQVSSIYWHFLDFLWLYLLGLLYFVG